MDHVRNMGHYHHRCHPGGEVGVVHRMCQLLVVDLVRQVALASKAAKPENVLAAAIAENVAARVENVQLCGLDRPLDPSHQVYHIHLMVSPLGHPTHILCRHSNHRSCLQCTQKTSTVRQLGPIQCIL